jgi:MFS family permease
VADAGAQSVGLLQVAVFLDELALLAVLAVAGARLADGTAVRIALAVLLPLLAAVAWGRWLAPRARGRLGHPARLVAKLALIAVASALLAWAGSPWWSAAFLVVSAALVTLGEMSERV